MLSVITLLYTAGERGQGAEERIRAANDRSGLLCTL